MKQKVVRLIATTIVLMVTLFVKSAFAQASQPQTSNLEIERKVFSFFIMTENVAANWGGGPEDAKKYFVVTLAVQKNGVTSEQLKKKFGNPTLIEPNVKYSTPGSMAPEFHNGDLWFYGRVGILIEDDNAVAVIRRVPVKGQGTESMRRAMEECVHIGSSSKSK